jgi:hypothetical protein
MKQYTTPEQTAKLIELGFAEPKSIRYPKNEEEAERVDSTDFLISDYSIGELLSFLPLTIQWTPRVIRGNVIEYSFETGGSELYYCNAHNELIDNLFDLCAQLKEEGVI